MICRIVRGVGDAGSWTVFPVSARNTGTPVTMGTGASMMSPNWLLAVPRRTVAVVFRISATIYLPPVLCSFSADSPEPLDLGDLGGVPGGRTVVIAVRIVF